jgi:hypothetical protein
VIAHGQEEAMGAILGPLLLIVVVLGFGAYAVVLMSRRQMQREDRAKRPDVETLRYHVPTGQDPAAVIAALHEEGFEAVEDHDAGFGQVLIPCLDGKDRERARARAVIGQAPLNLDGDPCDAPPVRFADEDPGHG